MAPLTFERLVSAIGAFIRRNGETTPQETN